MTDQTRFPQSILVRRARRFAPLGVAAAVATALACAPAFAQEEGGPLSEVVVTARFVSVQNELSLLRRRGEADLLASTQRHDLAILPYFPLAGGFLTGKYRRGQAAPPGSRGENSSYVKKYMTEANYDRLEKLEAWARARERTLGELAHAWLLAKDEVASVISGATRPEHVRASAKASDFELEPEDVEELDAMLA